ncbi:MULTISPECIES: ABC transporter substrate-binding protein [Catenuloplanes]|uniref:Multiple sugar transport system substrate-binding protein n=1 Tax=Catenuloplanes niger TaxID=587534 RepID=A0AAE4CQ59_9ACTN|nr:ABC transporter substrate-binding protein [Catenuloplanes niger]MDR7320172.1 multiple sugar transport system substrate-binding protein [Catenuloplanes niger]
MMDRRAALRAAALTAAGLGALSACGRGFGGGGDDTPDGAVVLTMVWWGDNTRARKTQAALDVFQRKNPGITVRTEYQDSAPYKDKLATRFAAGDPPDLMAMRMDSLREYADRGALLELAGLDLSGLGESARTLAAVGDRTYGVPSGLNSIGFVVNRTLTDRFGVRIPDGDTWGWDDLGTFARAVTEAGDGTVYGTGFDLFTLANLFVFTRQRGEDFFTERGTLGITAGTVQAWFEMAQRMRDERALPPAGFMDEAGSSAAQSYIASGKLASQIIPTNNFLSYNEAAGGNLALLRMPGETQGVRRGQSIDTPALWSIAARSKHPREALALLDFLINDPEASQATGTTRGVPPNQRVAAAIRPGLAKDDQVATDYLIGLQGETLPRSFTYPPGGSSIAASLETIATEVEFKRQTPADGAAAFIAEATKALRT